MIDGAGLEWQNRWPDENGFDWGEWDGKEWPLRLNYFEAEDYCQSLSLAGHSDWRLPNLDELRTLIKGCDPTETGGVCEATQICEQGCDHDFCRENCRANCEGCAPL